MSQRKSWDFFRIFVKTFKPFKDMKAGNRVYFDINNTHCHAEVLDVNPDNTLTVRIFNSPYDKNVLGEILDVQADLCKESNKEVPTDYFFIEYNGGKYAYDNITVEKIKKELTPKNNGIDFTVISLEEYKKFFLNDISLKDWDVSGYVSSLLSDNNIDNMPTQKSIHDLEQFSTGKIPNFISLGDIIDMVNSGQIILENNKEANAEQKKIIELLLKGIVPTKIIVMGYNDDGNYYVNKKDSYFLNSLTLFQDNMLSLNGEIDTLLSGITYEKLPEQLKNYYENIRIQVLIVDRSYDDVEWDLYKDMVACLDSF